MGPDILRLLGVGRLYLSATLEGEPVDTLTQLCLIREGTATSKLDTTNIIESIRAVPMVDTRIPDGHAMLDTRGHWNGALLKKGSFRAFVRFNKVGSLTGKIVVAEYCFEVDGGPLQIVAAANHVGLAQLHLGLDQIGGGAGEFRSARSLG